MFEGDGKWPAIAIQSVFLAANTGYIFAGQANDYLIASFAVLGILFMLQVTSKNARFVFLFPVTHTEVSYKNGETRRVAIPSAMLDTWILRGMIGAAVWLFFMGVTFSWKIATLVVVIGPALALVWDRYLNDVNKRLAHKKALRTLEKRYPPSELEKPPPPE